MSTSGTPADEEIPLRLSDVLDMARRNPPSIFAALARVQEADAQVDLAHAALMPTVSGVLTGTVAAAQTSILYGQSTIPAGLVFPGIVPTAALDVSVVARWPIWDFGRTRLAVDAAKHGVRSADDSVRGAERTAMASASRAYFTLLSDADLLTQIRETVRQREREAEIARGLVQSGTRAPIEQTRSEVALDSARADLTIAEGARRSDEATLASALALDPKRRLRLSSPPIRSVDDDPAHSEATALAARPELAAARASLARAEGELAAARAGYRPLLAANGSAGGRYTNHVLSDAVTEQGAAAITLTVPFLDPTVAGNIKVAEARVAYARAAFDQECLAVGAEAVQGAIALSSARATLAQAERIVGGASATLQQAQTQYATGAGSLLELLDAQGVDSAARIGVVRARLRVALATVQLLAAEGQLDELGRQS
jgi:outer membrane protein TolC